MMKKTYEAPVAEKVRFQYEEQVAASAGADIPAGSTDESGMGLGSAFEQYLSTFSDTCATRDDIHDFCRSLFDLF